MWESRCCMQRAMGLLCETWVRNGANLCSLDAARSEKTILSNPGQTSPAPFLELAERSWTNSGATRRRFGRTRHNSDRTRPDVGQVLTWLGHIYMSLVIAQFLPLHNCGSCKSWGADRQTQGTCGQRGCATTVSSRRCAESSHVLPTPAKHGSRRATLCAPISNTVLARLRHLCLAWLFGQRVGVRWGDSDRVWPDVAQLRGWARPNLGRLSCPTHLLCLLERPTSAPM